MKGIDERMSRPKAQLVPLRFRLFLRGFVGDGTRGRRTLAQAARRRDRAERACFSEIGELRLEFENGIQYL
jgi:hypothetical protein